MKNNKIYFPLSFAIACLLSIAMISCKSDSTSTGSSLLNDADLVIVGCDTFSLSSSVVAADAIAVSPDSLLLGECDNLFGTIKADIFTQLACPEGYAYPAGSVVDSVVLFLHYRSWYGDGDAPIGLAVRELDLATFEYSKPYANDIKVEDYCSLNDTTLVSEKEKVITASHYLDSTYSSTSSSVIVVPSVRMKLSDAFAQRFFSYNDFTSQENFSKQFKGLYITSTFGNSTILYVSSINLATYYHFTYDKQGTDTLIHDVKVFYANNEVRQLNSITYPQVNWSVLSSLTDSLNFISSPSNLYTQLNIPLQNMSDSITDKMPQKRPYVNLALLRVEVLNTLIDDLAERDKWAEPAEYMLLIKKDAAERFFADKELPTDTCALLSSLNSVTDSLGVTHKYYSYDLSSLLTRQLRQQNNAPVLSMLLIPVSLTTSSTTSIYGTTTTTTQSVNQQQTISSTIIRSAQSTSSPLQIEIVYSGF